MDFTIPDTRQVENSDGKPTTPTDTKLGSDTLSFIADRSWARQAFLLSDEEMMDQIDIKNRYWTSAQTKFTDTRMGCNIGVNSRPQFTRYSDIRVKGRLAGRNEVTLQNKSGNYGMGRYYSEAIDDTSQTVYLRFGVPQFNSLTDFFSKAFDPDWVTMVRTGRSSSMLRDVATAVGTVIAAVAAPALSLLVVGVKMATFFFGRATSKFYTLKPTMHMYWSAVGMLVNTLSVNSGILPTYLADKTAQKINEVYKIDNEMIGRLRSMLPDILTDNQGFNPFAFANKAQRLANQLNQNLYEEADKGTPTDYLGLVKKQAGDDRTITDYTKKDDTGIMGDITGVLTLPAWVDKTLSFGYYSTNEDKDAAPKTELKPNIDPKTGEEKKNSWWTEFGNYFDAELREGAQFAVFKVNHTGSPSESFTNSAVESELSNKFNQTSSAAREARFTFADGNLVGGFVGDVLGKIGTAVSDVATGLLSGVTFGISDALKGLAGGGFVDIPKHYQSSNARLPSASYTMHLISPYGNAISRLQNIYIPLAMIMAGGLPLSTGKQSYSSPFLVQLFDQGRCQIQLGMITEITITRGTSNLAFNRQGKPLAFEVRFTVEDLSSIMHMPISTGSLFGALKDAAGAAVNANGNNSTMDEDNILVDYLAVLAGQDMYSQIYPMPKAKLKLAKLITQNEKMISPAYWASVFHESATSGMMKYLTLGVVNAMGALTSENSSITKDGR